MGNYDLTNLREVAKFLTRNKIKYELDSLADGWQIGVPRLPRHGNCDFDIIIHQDSLGHKQGLLEIMGCISDDPDDNIEGCLNAGEVIDRIERNYLNKKNELELKQEFRKIVRALQDYCWTHKGSPDCNCIFYNKCCLIEEMMTEPNYGECTYLSPAFWDTLILGNEEGE